MRYPKTRLQPDPNRICKIEGCNSKAEALALCKMHYARFRRSSRIDGPKRVPPDYDAFIKSLFDATPDHCVEWPFHKKRQGYGRFYIGGKGIQAHREVCLRFHGEQPADKPHCAHSCGNRGCVNPHHIRWASALENNHDKIIHGRDNKGSKHGNSKLTEKQAAEIKTSTQKLDNLSEKYGVSISVISNIRNGKAWSHV